MNIELAKISKTTTELTVSGRLDTINAPMLEDKIKEATEDDVDLILDLEKLTYISSSGLRILLHAMKMQKQADRKFVVNNINNSIREVFEMTGFLNLMSP